MDRQLRDHLETLTNAPRPLSPNGGLPAVPIAVSWLIAEDEALTRVVQQGTVTTDPAWDHSVHAEVTGLRPDRWYWSEAGGEISPKGRTSTMPAAGSAPDCLRFTFASCQKYEIGHYTAYEHMVREDLGLVVHLGDYIYEKADDKQAIRPHRLPLVGLRGRTPSRAPAFPRPPHGNPVVFTGDIHSNWANEIPVDSDRPDAPPAAVEFVGTSISSGGDGGERADHAAALRAENPFVKFYNSERGYVRCEVTPAAWRTDYRTVPYVSPPGRPAPHAGFVHRRIRPAPSPFRVKFTGLSATSDPLTFRGPAPCAATGYA